MVLHLFVTFNHPQQFYGNSNSTGPFKPRLAIDAVNSFRPPVSCFVPQLYRINPSSLRSGNQCLPAPHVARSLIAKGV